MQNQREKLLEILKTFHPQTDYFVCKGVGDRVNYTYWIKRKTHHRIDTKVENLSLCDGCLQKSYQNTRKTTRRSKVTTLKKEPVYNLIPHVTIDFSVPNQVL